MMRHLGSNISPDTSQHAAKALAVIDIIRSQFLKDSNIYKAKHYHTIPRIY